MTPGPRSTDLTIAAAIVLLSLALAPPSGAQTWSPLGSPTVGPGLRRAHGGFHDAAGGRFVVFGGTRAGAGGEMDSVLLGDTWGYDFARGRWSAIHTGGRGPSPRFIFAFAHDTKRNELLVHGGYDGAFLDETWALSLRRRNGAWRRIVTTGPAPSPRDDHAAVYDPVGDRLLVFGGWSGQAYLADVWALTLGDDPAWRRIESTSPGPAPRRTPAAFYDPVAHRMIVFGGYNGSGFGDTWALQLGPVPRWDRLLEGGGPSPRWGQSLVWNPAAQVGLLFGGIDAVEWHSDVWELAPSPTPQWTLRRGDVPQPAGRLTHVAAYDAVADRLLVHGGLRSFEYFGDLWQLPLGSTTEAGSMPAARVVAGDPAVDLRGVPGEPRTWLLRFELARPGEAVAQLFDVRGRNVMSTSLGSYAAGRHEARFAADERLQSGVYFLRLRQANRILATRRLLLLP